MSKLKAAVTFETTFGTYTVDELLGEGGAGRVFGGKGHDGTSIAIKVLSKERASSDKRSRFKNEIYFLARNTHRNIVTVLDHGLARGGAIEGPFYVMPRYQSNLRQLIKDRISPADVLPRFSQILDGVEAAHLQGVIHRDLKPENILYDTGTKTLAVADFGIAKFSEDIVATLVETSPTQRLANFQYAAPEQRSVGQSVGMKADLYALGLILNEMFTSTVPHGTEFQTISSVSKEMRFLDDVVARMMRQNPHERPDSIAEIKGLIQRYESEAVAIQRISNIDNTVIPAKTVDDPFAFDPPKLVNFDWDGQRLTLILDRAVSSEWISSLQNLGNFTSVLGKEPRSFSFSANKAMVSAMEHEIQPIIDYFKVWLPAATHQLRFRLEEANQRQEAERKEKLRREREAEERRLNVLRSIKI